MRREDKNFTESAKAFMKIGNGLFEIGIGTPEFHLGFGLGRNRLLIENINSRRINKKNRTRRVEVSNRGGTIRSGYSTRLFDSTSVPNPNYLFVFVYNIYISEMFLFHVYFLYAESGPGSVLWYLFHASKSEFKTFVRLCSFYCQLFSRISLQCELPAVFLLLVAIETN